MGHGPEFSFSMFAKTYSSSFKLETTPFDKKLLSSVKGFQISSFFEGSKRPGFLGIFFQILSAAYLSLLFLSFINTLSHSEMAFLRLWDSRNSKSDQKWTIPSCQFIESISILLKMKLLDIYIQAGISKEFPLTWRNWEQSHNITNWPAPQI